MKPFTIHHVMFALIPPSINKDKIRTRINSEDPTKYLAGRWRRHQGETLEKKNIIRIQYTKKGEMENKSTVQYAGD